MVKGVNYSTDLSLEFCQQSCVAVCGDDSYGDVRRTPQHHSQQCHHQERV